MNDLDLALAAFGLAICLVGVVLAVIILVLLYRGTRDE